jgi:SNF2 family DNA or RNA helicase
VIQTWKDELKRFVTTLFCSACSSITRHLTDAISYCEYYGPERGKVYDKLQSYDLVVTTFSVVRLDWKAHLSASETRATLHAIEWHRVILDEGKFHLSRWRYLSLPLKAHIIREPAKSFAMSVCALRATRRWCVTGTPIQNRLLDLYSLFKFLKCSPFDDVRVFKAHISRDGRNLLDPSSVIKLKTLVNLLSLRRPKSTVHLPPRNDVIKMLDFNPRERQHYEVVKASAAQYISEASERAQRKAFLNALHRVNELRLVCNHGIKDKE